MTMRDFGIFAAGAALLVATAGQAQSSDISAANADLAPAAATGAQPAAPVAAPAPATPEPAPAPAATPAAAPAAAPPVATTPAGTTVSPTYHQQDILAAAEDTFGKGAEGLAKMIEKLFKEKGEPSGYIVGREAGGAVLVGVRYGSGTLFHKVEGNLPVYWTGPSFGIDLGVNGAKTFMLVYNLDDTNDLYKRFPGAEGSAYVIGGFTASHHRVGNIVVVPIHLGMGWRLGANIGYLKFTRDSKVSPF